MRFTIAAMSLCILLASPPQARSGGNVYYLIDTTGSPWLNSEANFFPLPLDNIDPNNPSMPNLAIFNIIMRHEFQNPFGASWEQPPSTPGGTKIQWTFDISNLQVVEEPANGQAAIRSPLTLTGLAHLGGFDHFNYVQHILGIPSYLQASLISNGLSQNLLPPYLDPYPNEPPNSVRLTNRTTGLFADVVNVDANNNPRQIDGYGYYYNDDKSLIGNYSQFQTSTSITFKDAPRKPGYLALPSLLTDYTLYQTSLVGVGADHSLVSEWTGWGTNITWSSNAAFSTINVNYAYDANPYDQGPTPDSGGIGFVRTDAAPEPSSLVLLGIGTVIILCVLMRGAPRKGIGDRKSIRLPLPLIACTSQAHEVGDAPSLGRPHP